MAKGNKGEEDFVVFGAWVTFVWVWAWGKYNLVGAWGRDLSPSNAQGDIIVFFFIIIISMFRTHGYNPNISQVILILQ